MAREAGEWHRIQAARFKHLHLHLACPLHFPLCVCVLDAPSHFEATSPFAAILVPRGHELDWVFCTSNGLWDLLSSASVSRLVVLRRLNEQQEEEEEEEQHGELPRREQEGYLLEMRANLQGNVCVDAVLVANKGKEQEEQGDISKYAHYLRLGKNHATCNSHEHETDRHQHAQIYCVSGDHQWHPPLHTDITAWDNDSDDAFFKRYIAPLLHLLFPWSICHGGPAPDPYVTYEDHVRIRLILEKRHTETLGGGVLVEDVELDCSLDDGASVVGRDSGKCMPRLRRRMRFQHMPNLIQTEVLIAVYKNGHFSPTHGLKDVKAAQEKLAMKNGSENGSFSETRELGAASRVEFEVRLDHSKLVHKYLPPIVAGLVLATPCLEACTAANQRARFLTIGLGGGALPVFLQRQLGFTVVAVDTDEIVVDLARRHFGFVENECLEVRVMDGMDAVFSIAHQACNNGFISAQTVKDLQAAMEDSGREVEILGSFERSDARMHVIVVDVNAADACAGLLSPPPCFLTKAFLLAVRIALHEGGMLVINVIPRAKHNLKEAVDSLREFFSGVYQIQIEDNHVLFLFLSRIADINMGSGFASRLARSIGDDLFDKIEEIE